jgi:hypothetical protein
MSSETDAPAGALDWNLLINPPPEMVGQQVSVLKVCDDGSAYGVSEIVTFTLPLAGPPSVDPRELALMARGRLPFPLPVVSFSPPLDSPDDFLLVQFPTWIRIENWSTESRSASAGAVTATVTARPIRQVWDFDPRTSNSEFEGGCAAQGASYDPSRPPEVQSTPCSFTFRHSSAGQPHPFPDAYEAHLSVVYEITWTSNIGAGGSLGTVIRTTVMPVRVGEQQALNESGGTDQ